MLQRPSFLSGSVVFFSLCASVCFFPTLAFAEKEDPHAHVFRRLESRERAASIEEAVRKHEEKQQAHTAAPAPLQYRLGEETPGAVTEAAGREAPQEAGRQASAAVPREERASASVPPATPAQATAPVAAGKQRAVPVPADGPVDPGMMPSSVEGRHVSIVQEEPVVRVEPNAPAKSRPADPGMAPAPGVERTL